MLRGSRSVGRHAESLIRQAEAVVGMGMAANAVGAWRERHEQLLDEQAGLDATSSRLSALARIARQVVQMTTLGIGAWLVVDAGASPGIMIAATILLARALQPVEHLISGWKQLVDSRGAWQRLAEPDALAAPQARLRLPAPAGRLELERVVFAHDTARPPLIKGISFSMNAGESLGIVGASGSGKTTLARVLVGVWQPQSGAVRLDSANLAHWDRTALGAHLGYLPQDASLFAGTVAQNIARLGPIEPGEVIKAARLAQVHDMILRLPDGYDTVVGDAGIRLSGGQRQRIALARALYGRPKLVVLDEPDAHLDAEGEDALKSVIQALKACGTTLAVVSHRAGLIGQLDKIAVLKEGALQAFGPAAGVPVGAHARKVHVLPASVSSARGVVA
jgi:PrtD family type I secretion system ABC transporter